MVHWCFLRLPTALALSAVWLTSSLGFAKATVSAEVSVAEATNGAIAQTDSSIPAPPNLFQDQRQRLLSPNPTLEPIPIPVEAPLPAPPQLNPDFATYRLGPGDSIFVSVQRFPDLSFQTTLDLQGNVFVPLVGALNLEGLSLEAARNLIQRELNRYVVNPEVDAILIAQRPVQVTLLGEVVRPGYYPLEEPQLLTALNTAGGTTEFADLREVRIRRRLPDQTVIEQDIDLYSPLRQGNSLPEIQLADGDTVIVPTVTGEHLDDYDPTLIARSTLAQPEIVVRVLNYAARGTSRGVEGNLSGVTVPNGSTFLDALTQISLNPDRADLSDVALIRFDPASGRAVVTELNVRDALRGDTSQDPPLRDNDVIVVGRDFIGRITYALNTIAQPFKDVLGFLLFFDEVDNAASDLFGDDE